jgi:hypothetical protein
MSKKCKGPCLKHCYNDSLNGLTLILIAIVIMLIVYSIVSFNRIMDIEKKNKKSQ